MENRRERENRKRRLRAGIIENEEMTSLDEKKISKERKKYRRRRLTVIVLMIALVAVGLLGYKFYQMNHQYTDVTVEWTKEMSEGSFSGYEEFGENVIKYTRDGAVYLGKTGKEIWNQAYEMKSPFVSARGDYAVVADRNGYSIYICDRNGCQGVVTTTLPISKAAVSSTGVTVAILEDSHSNFITFYDKSGTKLQIEVQTTLAGNGYPIDLSISPNGMMLMVSYMYLDEGLMQNQVVFYNFDEEGQNVKDRLVAGFKEFESSMVARVRFLDNTYACAFAQDRLCFYSLENTVKPTLLKQEDVENEILSIFYSEKYAGTVTKNPEGGKRLTVYDSSGEKQFETDFSMEYEEVCISENQVLLYREAECAVYNMAGKLKYQGTLDGSINKLISLGDSRYIQISPQSMKGLELK